MSKVYKAIFRCEATDEKRVWYVSSRTEGRRMLREHIGSSGKKTLAIYRHNDWTYELKPVFTDDLDVSYDAVTSWSGN
jgi:hypothetical protein